MTTKIAVFTAEEIEEIVRRAIEITLAKAVKDSHTPPMMTKAQVSEYLRKSVSTIDRYMREGTPYRKILNGHPEFSRKDIDSWVVARFQKN